MKNNLKFGDFLSADHFIINKVIRPLYNIDNELDGTINREIKSRIYKEKTIQVEITLIQEKGKYSSLSIHQLRDLICLEILRKQTAKLIFDDQPDRYWQATLDGDSDITLLNPKTGKVVLNFLVPDGMSHSVVTRIFPAVTNSDGILEAEIINEGTVSVPINYRIKHNHENGYIGVISELGAAQIGDAQEADTEIIEKSPWVIRDDLYTQFNQYWTTGQGNLFTREFQVNGSWAKSNLGTREYLSYGNLGASGGWHGSIKTRKFSANGNGTVGSASFTATVRLLFENAAINSAGIMQFVVSNADATKRIGFTVHKFSASNNKCWVNIFVSGDPYAPKDHRVDFELAKNKTVSYETGIFEFKKIKDKITITFGGKAYSFVKGGLRDTVFDNVTIFSGAHGTTPSVTRMSWDYVFVQTHGVKIVTDNDVPNSFRDGSEIVIDNENSKYYYNPDQETFDTAIPIPDANGSVWFKAPPGKTKVQFYYSDFSVAPDVTAEIREAFY